MTPSIGDFDSNDIDSNDHEEQQDVVINTTQVCSCAAMLSEEP